MSRVACFGLVFGAAFADQLGAHPLAFYALLAAVPLAASAGLEAISDDRDPAAYVWALVLGLLLVATAFRAPATGEPSVPGIARSALLACVAVFCFQALAALAAELRHER